MRRVRAIVDNRIRLSLEDLTPAEAADVRGLFTHDNPAAAKLRAFGFGRRAIRASGEKKTISTWRDEDGGWLSVPRGGLGQLRVLISCFEPQARLSVSDRRHFRSGDSERVVPEHGRTLWPFQERLVEAAIRHENCLWRSPQASGKTTASIALASRLDQPSLFVVSTSNLLDQWVERCREELGIEPGVLSGRRKRVEDVTVAMQQTLRGRARDLRGRFGLVVCDEVQQFAASTFQEVIDELDCRWRLGVSADERRSDGKEFLIRDQFGDVEASVTHDELVEDGFIHEVQVRVRLSEARADWYAKLTEPRHKVQARGRLIEQLDEDAGRNRLVADVVAECVMGEGEQVVVLTNRREHCRELERLCAEAGMATGLLIGGADYRDQFQSTLSRMRRRECDVGVGTLQAVGVGFDLPQVARGVIAAPVASNSKGRMQFQQFRGRFARTSEGKRDAALHYVHDPRVFGHQPVRHLCRWSRDVVVFFGGEWIEARRYLKEQPDAKPTTTDDEQLGDALSTERG